MIAVEIQTGRILQSFDKDQKGELIEIEIQLLLVFLELDNLLDILIVPKRVVDRQ
jgi:hypothetical protein